MEKSGGCIKYVLLIFYRQANWFLLHYFSSENTMLTGLGGKASALTHTRPTSLIWSIIFTKMLSSWSREGWRERASWLTPRLLLSCCTTFMRVRNLSRISAEEKLNFESCEIIWPENLVTLPCLSLARGAQGRQHYCPKPVTCCSQSGAHQVHTLTPLELLLNLIKSLQTICQGVRPLLALRLCGSTQISNSVLSLIQSLCQQMCYNLNIRWPSINVSVSKCQSFHVSADSVPSDLAPAVIFLQVKTLWSSCFSHNISIDRIWWRKRPARSQWSSCWTVWMILLRTQIGTPSLGFLPPCQITARKAIIKLFIFHLMERCFSDACFLHQRWKRPDRLTWYQPSLLCPQQEGDQHHGIHHRAHTAGPRACSRGNFPQVILFINMLVWRSSINCWGMITEE